MLNKEQLFGLVGYPLTHSYSQKFFSSFFKKNNIKASYHNFPITNLGSLSEIIESHPNLCGLNITIPHKKSIIPLLTHIQEDAQKIGAVNVVKIIHNPNSIELVGFNTDYIGFLQSIKPLLKNHHKRALILGGSGGAAKSIIYALQQLNIQVTIVSRKKINNQAITYDLITKDIIESHQIIINCTPLGMYPKTNFLPPIPYDFLTPNHLLYDLIYNPTETLFLKKGKQKGATIKNGEEMLFIQALESWNIWNNYNFYK